MKSDSAQHSILIVDDTPANLDVLSEMLRRRGYRARPVPNGKLALQAANSDPPALVLLDIMMPAMNGYEVCQKLKASEQLNDVPVIFISALNESIDKVRAFDSGGVDYITKPFQFDEVLARVETHLKIRDLQLSLKRHNLELERSYAELRKLEAMRDSLTHMIIHDLKGPLTGVTGCLELLRDDAADVPAAWRETIAIAEECGASMLRMVDDTLTVSRLESGRMPLAVKRCNLQDLIRQTITSMKGTLRGRFVDLQCPRCEVTIDCDAHLIQRVLTNLLSNAAKYSPDGKPIDIVLGETPRSVRVTVHDQGQGVPEEYRRTIFDKFCQVEAGSKRVPHSSGLGLAFCQAAVTAHGGSIGVESTPGRGSEFWFELPRRGPGESPTEAAARTERHAALEFMPF